MTPRFVSPSDLIRIECASATVPGYEAYDEPRRWHILTTQHAIDTAEASGRRLLVPTYQPNGRKTASMLCDMPPGLRRAWERRHGNSGMVHLNYIHNARPGHDRYGCRCPQCTAPETARSLLED